MVPCYDVTFLHGRILGLWTLMLYAQYERLCREWRTNKPAIKGVPLLPRLHQPPLPPHDHLRIWIVFFFDSFTLSRNFLAEHKRCSRYLQSILSIPIDLSQPPAFCSWLSTLYQWSSSSITILTMPESSNQETPSTEPQARHIVYCGGISTKMKHLYLTR